MKYWVYDRGRVLGEHEPHELARLPNFALTSMVCPAYGSGEEKNWRRAGLFPDIVDALRHAAAAPPSPPLPASEFADPQTPPRLFSHVRRLMEDLEGRREEQALLRDLQDEVARLKLELRAARERIRFLEDRTLRKTS